MKIRSLTIDFDREVLEINGETIGDSPVIVSIPGFDGWVEEKLFNPHLASGIREDCDRLSVTYEKSKNRL